MDWKIKKQLKLNDTFPGVRLSFNKQRDMASTKKKTPKKKPMSEGTAIVLIVLGLTLAGFAVYYLLRWFIGLFFPDLL